VTRRLKPGIVEQEEEAIARQWRCKHVSAATNQHATVEELLEALFSVRSVPTLYSEDQREKLVRRGRSRQLLVLSCIVSSRYLAKTSEKTEDYVRCSSSNLYSV
jgi:hypothetical protein